MKNIIIKSQKEWDELPDSFEEFTVLDIREVENLIIKSNPNNSSARLFDNSSAELWGNSSAELWGNSSAELWGNSSAELFDNSSAELFDNSSARLHDNSSAELWGNSSARLHDNSSARLFDNSSARLFDNSSARLYNNSSARLYNNSSAQLFDNSSAELWGNSSAELFLQSIARVFSKNVTIKAYDTSTIYLNSHKIGLEKENTVNLIQENITPTFEQWLGRGIVYADGIYQRLEEVITEGKEFKTDKGFVVRDGDEFSHGETLEEARLDLEFKINPRKIDYLKDYNLDSKLLKREMVLAYRRITGACSFGVKEFLKNNKIPEELTIRNAIKLTKGHYGHEEFKGLWE